MTDPMNDQEIGLRGEAEAVIAEPQAELVLFADEFLNIAFPADQIAVKTLKQLDGGSAVERANIGPCRFGLEGMLRHYRRARSSGFNPNSARMSS
jgi:hypothetical protein